MKQKNEWLDSLIVLLFVAGVLGVCASLTVGAFKIHSIIGCLVASAEVIVIASILHDIKDR